MLYRQFYSWADTPILLQIDLPHLHLTTPGICMSTLGPFDEQEQTPTGRRTEVCMQSLFETVGLGL